MQHLNIKDIKFNLQGLDQLKDLNVFLDTQPASVFDGLSPMSIIRLYLITKENGFDRFTQWLEQDFEEAQAAYKSVVDQGHFGKGGFIQTFEDLAIDPR